MAVGAAHPSPTWVGGRLPDERAGKTQQKAHRPDLTPLILK